MGFTVLDDIVIQHPSNEELALEFSGGTIRSWPTEGQLLVVSLNRKYPILHKIGISNWIPSTHASIVSATMGHFIYFVGKEAQLNVGKFIFHHLLRHVDTFGINIPICFPCLLSAFLLSQRASFLSPL